MNKMPTDYEKEALAQIWNWKNPEQSWFDRAMEIVSWPLDKTTEAFLKTPGVGPAFKKALAGGLTVINDASQWSVRRDVILNEYRSCAGVEVTELADLSQLDLVTVDRVIGWLDAKYKGLALTEGALAGSTSVLTPAAAVAVIPADVTALLSLNLRAIGEYATYCGFDISDQSERLFALNVLALASSPSDNSKQLALAQLVRIARAAAEKKAWRDLERSLFVKVVQRVSKTLSIRLTKAKLAQVIPVAGAVIGGGFNAYFTSRVCEAAYYLYRERFLAGKYGVEVIEVTVEPAKSLEPDYEDVPEEHAGDDHPLFEEEGEDESE